MFVQKNISSKIRLIKKKNAWDPFLTKFDFVYCILYQYQV